jgi:hypothetical protein
MNHCLPEILSGRLTSLMAPDDIAPGTVMIQHMCVIDREVVEPAIRVVDRITTAAHHIANEAIGLDDGASWFIDEPGLHGSPRSTETLRILTRQRPDRKLLDSLLSLLQFPFSLCRRSRGPQDVVVFGTEAVAQCCSPTAPQEQPHPNDKCHRDDDDCDDHQHLVIHGSPRHRFSRKTSKTNARQCSSVEDVSALKIAGDRVAQLVSRVDFNR